MSAIDTTLDNIVSHWELEEASGTRVDSHGSNDLTDNATVTQGTGKQGNCADFETANTEFLEITDASQTGLDVTSTFSVSMWLNPESLPGSGVVWGVLAKDGFGISSDRQYSIDLYNNAGTQTIRLFASGNAGGSSFNEYTWTYTMSTATWYHLVFTYDVSLSAANRGKLYVNATDRGAASYAGAGTVTTIYSGNAPFRLARYSHTAVWTPTYDGLMDEVTFTSDVITSGEVTTIYNSGAGIPYTGGGGAAPTPLLSLMGVGS